MNLKNASVIGHFSLPPASLAQQNPDAYNNAMRNAPEGAGSCAHCGTGILHHVIIRTVEGKTAFIGQDCAARVGIDSDCIRYKLTTEQKVARDARRANEQAQTRAKYQAAEVEEGARRFAHLQKFAAAIESLRRERSAFHNSLADQIVAFGQISERQAEYVCKSVFGRENKKNIEARQNLFFSLVGPR